MIPRDRSWDVANIWLFSRATHAIAGTGELWVRVDDARRVLARPAAVDRVDQVTWGDVTREELERLVEESDVEDRDFYLAEIDGLPFDAGPCSLSYPSDP